MYEEIRKDIEDIKKELSSLKTSAGECERKAVLFEKIIKDMYSFYAKQKGITSKHKLLGQTNGRP